MNVHMYICSDKKLLRLPIPDSEVLVDAQKLFDVVSSAGIYCFLVTNCIVFLIMCKVSVDYNIVYLRSAKKKIVYTYIIHNK